MSNLNNFKHPDAIFNQFCKAAKLNKIEEVIQCFNQGLDPNDIYFYGELLSSPISVLVTTGKFKILNALYESGYRIIEKKYVYPLVELLKKKKYTFNQVEFLYNMGADVNERSLYGNTPFTNACCKNKLKIAKFLQEKGANIHSVNKFGVNAFGNCLYRNYNRNFFIWLIKQGIDLKHKDYSGENVIDYMKRINVEKDTINHMQRYLMSEINKDQLIVLLRPKRNTNNTKKI